MDTYEIYSLKDVEEEISNISNTNNELKTVVSDINDLITYLTSNWENVEGADISSSISNLKLISSNLEENIVPLYDKITSVLSEVVTETRRIQATEYNKSNFNVRS